MARNTSLNAILIPACLAATLMDGRCANAQDKRVRTADPTKSLVVERPAKNVLAGASAGLAAGELNPKVQPGLVSWQPSFAAACAAAKKSGKPVLLFQMMGRLDEQFC